MNLDALQLGIDLLSLTAIAAFAASGVIQAARSQLDAFGALVLGLVTAFGGGTLRDLLLGQTPVFWVEDRPMMAVALIACLITGTLVGRVQTGLGLRYQLLNWVDAIGLSIFSIVGASKAHAMGAGTETVVIMAVITGSFGGLLRDMLCQQKPAVLHPGELYATCCIVGALVYSLCVEARGDAFAQYAGMSVTFTLRALTLRFGLRLPAIRRAE